MDGDRRLTQLRALIARLERLPESPRREWMLQEARARMVDVETGYEPRPMRSLAEEPAPPDQARTVKRPSPQAAPAVTPHRPLPPEPSPAPAPPRSPSPEPGTTPLGDDTLLWLGDSSDDAVAEPGDGSPDAAPWRRGLRG